MVYGESTAAHRQLRLNIFSWIFALNVFQCVCERTRCILPVFHEDFLRLVDLIHETDDLQEVLSHAGWEPQAFDLSEHV